MNVKLVLLKDEENGISPWKLPWKEDHEPFVGVLVNDAPFDLVHTDIMGKNLIKRLLSKVAEVLDFSKKNPLEFLMKEKYSLYSNLEKSLKDMLKGSLGSCVEIKKSEEEYKVKNIFVEEEYLENYFSVFKRQFQQNG